MTEEQMNFIEEWKSYARKNIKVLNVSGRHYSRINANQILTG